jgi:hypothetical protein
MSTLWIRNHKQVNCHVYRLEPLRDNRLAMALVVLMGFATVSVLAGTQAASAPPAEHTVILLHR